MGPYDQTFRELINKMLEPHDVDYDHVVRHPKIKGKEWYNHFTWTPDQEKEYRIWAKAFLRKRHKWNEKLIEHELSWFLFAYGLKTVEEK